MNFRVILTVWSLEIQSSCWISTLLGLRRLGEYNLLLDFILKKSCSSAENRLHIFGCSLFQKSHNPSESWEHIGYTWRSNLFQGSWEEVKLVLWMNKQLSQKDSSLDALTAKSFSFSEYHRTFSKAKNTLCSNLCPTLKHTHTSMSHLSFRSVSTSPSSSFLE